MAGATAMLIEAALNRIAAAIAMAVCFTRSLSKSNMCWFLTFLPRLGGMNERFTRAVPNSTFGCFPPDSWVTAHNQTDSEPQQLGNCPEVSNELGGSAKSGSVPRIFWWFRGSPCRGCTWPVVAMTGNDARDLPARARSLGAVDFIEKPFDVDMLLVALRRACRLLDG
jgi:hypothetical protein